MSKRSDVDILSTNYKSFKGVDFTTDPSLVDKQRSPWATNMISDEGGNPEKRCGYKRLVNFGVDSEVNGIYTATFSGVKHYLAHVGTTLYRFYTGGTFSSLKTGFPNSKSMSVYMNQYLWIFTGSGLYYYDGTSVNLASSNAYVPLTVISCAAGSTPGGVTYEGINYLSSQQRVSFKGDGTNADFHLPYTSVSSVDLVTVDGETKTVGTHYTVNTSTGVVTFTSGNIPSAPSAGAADNVEIKFTKTFTGYADRINHCTTAIAWGVNGASDRIVCTGDSNFPNRDYICGYLNGFYFSDSDYQVVGNTSTKIVGYRRIQDQLAIIKEDNGQDSTVFLRSGSLDDDGNAIWSTLPCLSGVGGVTRFGFGNINDDQLVLTKNGVFAITSNSITAEKIAENRSRYVDPKLKTEDLEDAYCVSFKNMFMVFVNGNVYILDGRQGKSYSSSNVTTFTYECAFWDSIPATTVLVTDDELYFGTEDGKIMTLMFDETTMKKYSDGGYMNGSTWVDGDPISAVWATKSDDDGDPMIYKTMLKKGNAVTLKPYSRSSAKVCIRTDKDTVEWQCNYGTMDIFDWEDIDFARFTFNSNDAPREIPFNRKVKNYKRLQIIVKNDKVNEGFGVFGIVKHYVTGNFAKK